jgi:hypothetical protein
MSFAPAPWSVVWIAVFLVTCVNGRQNNPSASARVIDLINDDVVRPLPGQQQGNVVRTLEGDVFGTLNTTKNKETEFYAYRGIPYAVPPLGDLRFKVCFTEKAELDEFLKE